MKIIQKTFDWETAGLISKEWYGKNWPVVYILNSRTEAYIGETTSITNRMKQHLDSSQRKSLKQTSIIIDKRFNKSAVLDIESKLIEYMSADQKFSIQNSNSGMRNHNYYDKDIYDSLFRSIWNDLRKKKIADHDIDLLYNSEIFKYTPYKSLTEEQFTVMRELIVDILDSTLEGKESTTVINGEAGTGKTVMAMYLMKLFADKKIIDFLSFDNEELITKYETIVDRITNFKIALVVPMTSLRGTLKKVAKSITGLDTSMIIGPNDVAKTKYDLLIVDESHRLYRRVGITGYGSYDLVNKKLLLDKESTQLDWIIKQSSHNVFFYDETQSVRPSDIRKQDFLKLKDVDNYSRYTIQSQLRVLGGADYIKYISSLLYNKVEIVRDFKDKDYDFRMFDSISDMRNEIYNKEREVGLSRVVAGYAWFWKSKGKSYQDAMRENLYDIHIESEKFIWNTTNSSWVMNKNSVNEVGSIHTIQGYDLNYVGVIIGGDLTYNTNTNSIEIVKVNYFDSKGKVSILNDEELKDYILNIYKVLLTRGIKGTYVYVVDANLRDYLNRFIENSRVKSI